MNVKKNLLLINLILSFMGVGQVWQVQLSSYPLWAYVGPNEFRTYHIAWWHSIWIPLFIPAGLAIVCTIALLWWRPSNIGKSSVRGAIVVLIITYVLTSIWWGPLMALIGSTPVEAQDIVHAFPYFATLGLQSKTEPQLYALLLSTHWLRTALLTLYGILIFRMAIKAFDLKSKFIPSLT
jgi:hypothetical protein